MASRIETIIHTESNVMKRIKYTFTTLILFLIFSSPGCSKKEAQSQADSATQQIQSASAKIGAQLKVTFVELGSVNCIPCKMMQPVMKSIEAKYSGQVKVIFYDVWKDRRPAEQYGINLIPTQVFLDENGIEILRHEGFLAEEEIDRFLTSRGLSIIQ